MADHNTSELQVPGAQQPEAAAAAQAAAAELTRPFSSAWQQQKQPPGRPPGGGGALGVGPPMGEGIDPMASSAAFGAGNGRGVMPMPPSGGPPVPAPYRAHQPPHLAIGGAPRPTAGHAQPPPGQHLAAAAPPGIGGVSSGAAGWGGGEDENILPLKSMHKTKGAEVVCNLRLEPWPLEHLEG